MCDLKCFVQVIDDRTTHSTKSQHESLETFECEIQLKFSNQRIDTAKPSASMSVLRKHIFEKAFKIGWNDCEGFDVHVENTSHARLRPYP